MKLTFSHLGLLSLIASSLAYPDAQAQTDTAATARVIRLKGAARASSGNYVWQKIKVGNVLPAGTIVQTSADPGAYVDLALGENTTVAPPPAVYQPSIPSSMSPWATTYRPAAEQNVLRLWDDSALGIDRLSRIQTGAEVVSDTQLDLKRGRLTARVKKLSGASKYEVKFANGVAGVRGTVFDMQASGLLKVYIGSVVVAWVDPKTQAVTTQTVVGGQVYDNSLKQVELLSIGSMGDLEQLSQELVVSQVFAGSTTLAIDRTMIGMSPVAANPKTVPRATPPPPIVSSGVDGSAYIGLPPVVIGSH